QAVQVREAAAAGHAYHMYMPDMVYSANYMPRLFALAEWHGDIIHNAVNATVAATDDLELYRQADNSLAIPAVAMGDIAWSHLHARQSQYLMNGAEVPVRMPYTHFHIWRARDRLMFFSPHNGPVYLTPRTASRLGYCTGTMDTQTQKVIGADFFAPSIDDDMAVICLELGSVDLEHWVDWHDFAHACWMQIECRDDHLEYYKRPIAEMPTAIIDDTAPAAADVLAMQADIVGRLLKEIPNG
ncbi:MAG TPA: hypothetical protein VF501_06640, partial [Thiobacillus sp.]